MGVDEHSVLRKLKKTNEEGNYNFQTARSISTRVFFYGTSFCNFEITLTSYIYYSDRNWNDNNKSAVIISFHEMDKVYTSVWVVFEWNRINSTQTWIKLLSYMRYIVLCNIIWTSKVKKKKNKEPEKIVSFIHSGIKTLL